MQIVFVLIASLMSFTSFSQWYPLGNNISGSAVDDLFGNSLSMSGDGLTYAAGAPQTGGIYYGNGYVKVLRYHDGEWIQKGSVITGVAEDDCNYVNAINFNGNILAVGAPLNDQNGENAGIVKVYQYLSGDWVQIGEDILGQNPEECFGAQLLMDSSGTVLAVFVPVGYLTSYVSVYWYNGSQWVPKGNPIYGYVGDFGISMDITTDGNMLAIGSHNGSGVVKVFEFDGFDWVQKGNDLSSDEEWDAFGRNVSINGDGSIVAVGADWSIAAGEYAGKVRVFSFDGLNWVQMGASIYGEPPAHMGSEVCLSDDGYRLLIGAYGYVEDEYEVGAVFVYEYDESQWVQVGDAFLGQYGSTGTGEWISSSQDASIFAYSSPFYYSDRGLVEVWVNYLENFSVSYDTLTACNNLLNPSGDVLWIGSGDFIDVIPNFLGCDSFCFVNLTIVELDTLVYQINDTLYTNADGTAFQWVDCANDYLAIAGATNNSFFPEQSGEYAVIVYTPECSDTSQCHSYYAVGSVSENEIFKRGFSPNPTNGIITINKKAEDEVIIYDIFGKQIYSGNDNRLDLTNHPDGLYIIIIRTNGREYFGKIILQNSDL